MISLSTSSALRLRTRREYDNANANERLRLIIGEYREIVHDLAHFLDLSDQAAQG